MRTQTKGITKRGDIMKFRKMKALALVAMAVLTLTACSEAGDVEEVIETETKPEVEVEVKTEEDIKTEAETDVETEKGVLKIGTESGYAPFEFKMIVDGEEKIVGFDMDLAYEIGKDLGREVEIVDMPFDSLILELQAGNVELVIACLNPDEKRRKEAEVSKSYYDGGNSILVRKDDLDKYADIASLEGEEISVLSGSVQSNFIKESMIGSTAIDLPTVNDAIAELKIGNVTAMAAETPVAEMNVKSHPDLVIAFDFVDPSAEGTVVAAQKGNTALIEEVNKTIDRVMADGSLDAYIAKAFADAEALADAANE